MMPLVVNVVPEWRRTRLEREQTLNQLPVEMHGLAGTEGIIVITNETVQMY